jgi:hypothetical protein
MPALMVMRMLLTLLEFMEFLVSPIGLIAGGWISLYYFLGFISVSGW